LSTRLSFIIAALLSVSPLISRASGPGFLVLVSETEAHALAVSTLTVKAQHLPGMRFGRDEETANKLAPSPAISKRFYWFDVTAKVPDEISPTLGYFAVNKETGDVWSPVPCKRLTSSFIRSFQRRLLRSRRISDQEFRNESIKAPCEP
jgi:hypothetical protein